MSKGAASRIRKSFFFFSFFFLMSARYYCESFLITHLCLVLSSAKRRSLPTVPPLYSRACLKPPACYGKQMLSRLYYFSKHSYPLPCYFLWSARLATLAPSPPLVSARLTPSLSPPPSAPWSSLPANRDGPAASLRLQNSGHLSSDGQRVHKTARPLKFCIRASYQGCESAYHL